MREQTVMDGSGAPTPRRWAPGGGRRRPRRLGLLTGTVLLSALVPLGVASPASAAAPWLAASELTAPSTNFGGSSEVGMADDGTTIAVSLRRDAAVTQVVASVRPPGGTFSAAVPISDLTASAGSLDLAVDPQGNATAAWSQGGVVTAAYRPVGGSWGAPQPLSSTDGSAPAVSAGPGGGAAVGWYNTTATVATQRARVAVRAPGAATFSAATNASSGVNTAGTGVYTPSTAMDAAGNVVAVWARDVDVAGTIRRVVESAIKPAGSAGFSGTSDARSSTSTGNAGFDPVVRMTPSGRAIAVWTFSDGVNPTRLDYADRAPGGSFGSATTLSATSSSGPRAAIDAGGTVAVSWAAGTTVTTSVRAFGGAFSSPRAVSGAGAFASSSTVAISDSGEAVVAWQTGSAADYALFAARRRPGGDGFGETTEIVRGAGAAPTTIYTEPDVDLDGEGNGFVVARKTAGSPAVYSAVAVGYDVVAPAVSALTVPGTATTGASVGLSASAADRMSAPTFAWSFGDGTTATGAAPSHAWGAPGVYTVTLTATDGAGNATTATRSVQVSAPAAGGAEPVPAGPAPAGPVPGGSPPSGGTTKPATLKAPRVTRPKKLKVGARLSVPATLKGASRLRFQWLRSGKPIRKATKRSYAVVRKDRGKRLSCRLTVLAGGKTVKLTTGSVRIPRR